MHISAKLRVVELGRRMTFRDAIEYANGHLTGEVVALANSDIFFDQSLARLGDPATLDMTSRVFALGTWQSTLTVDQGGAIMDATVGGVNATFLPRVDSQDAWIFRSPLKESVLALAGFEMGRPRCDGRLARVFMDAGYVVTNPALSIVAHHLHSAAPVSLNSRSGATSTWRREKKDTNSGTYSGDTQVPGDIASVLISDQWLF
ncbi:unnamed protein product [Sphacelaria rigidula]